MTLSGSMTACCAALQASLNFNQLVSPELYRVVGWDSVNRLRWTSTQPQALKWEGTAGSNFVRLSFYDDYTLMPSSDPIQQIEGPVIDCNPGVTALGAQWFEVVYIQFFFFNRKQFRDIYWMHIQRLGSNTNSIGFYRPGWLPS
jgi:hypothetical protein